MVGYMRRKKFYIPKKEVFRDYRDGHENSSFNYLFKCDFIEVLEDGEDEVSTDKR